MHFISTLVLLIYKMTNILATKGQTVYLDIRRTAANRLRCTFPECENRTQRLHDFPRKVRFKVMKQRKIYIPDGARACDRHLSEIPWNTITNNTGQQSKFSAKQIKDLIELLRNSGSKIVSKIPG